MSGTAISSSSSHSLFGIGPDCERAMYWKTCRIGMQVVAYLHLLSNFLTPLPATRCGNRKLMAYAKPVRCFIYIAKPASPCLTSQDIYVYCACHCSSCYLSTCSPSLILRRHVCRAPNDSNPTVAPPPRKRNSVYPNLDSTTECYLQGVYLVRSSVMLWFH
jgi:hypothetical protein